ncbi:MAG TPA: orotate phosphoribosyltransferase [Thermoanaerobaculia bacterium]|nr:orotate phosphoribosyltransferase [Thermoanaerobaculia bacterium]
MNWRHEFDETGALLSGHFRLSSGLHSDRYLQCALILQWPERARRIGDALGGLLGSFAPSVVVGPALGGVIVGHETARALGVRSVFTERKDGTMQLRRGFSFARGERAVVVEDVFTTGKSTRETIVAVEQRGARVVAAGSIVDRGLPPDALAVPWRSLLAVEAPGWPENGCPLCAEGFPLEAPGSRHPAA